MRDIDIRNIQWLKKIAISRWRFSLFSDQKVSAFWLLKEVCLFWEGIV